MLSSQRSLRTVAHVLLLALTTSVLFAQTPPGSIQEDWFDHRQTIDRVYYNDQVAIYFDRDVDRNNTWMYQYLTDAWRYTKDLYDPFGEEGTDESRLYGVFHRGRHGGGHPGTYVAGRHGYRNIIDVGAGPWDCKCGTPLDLVTHEIAHIVELASFGVESSPAFGLWGDSKWAEIYQYDVYDGLGMTVERDRWYNQMIASTDNFPVANANWFRDFWIPIYNNYGGSTVLRNYFKVLSENFLTTRRDFNGQIGRRYTRRLNWGEFFHFMSGAANNDIQQIVTDAFGWNSDYERQYRQAQRDFPLPYHSGPPNPGGQVNLFLHCNYQGSSIAIGPGNFTAQDLANRGMSNNEISSLRIADGMVVTLYPEDNFGGTPITLTGDDACLVDNGFNDRTSSIRVTTNNVDLTEDGGSLTASINNSPGGEGLANLTDNSGNTKFLIFGSNVSVTYRANARYLLTEYTLTSANDFPGRDPGSWTLSGSNDGNNWTTLDNRTNETFANRFEKRSFTVSNSAPFSYYRLNMTARNTSLNIVQVAEMELFGSATSQLKSVGKNGPEAVSLAGISKTTICDFHPADAVGDPHWAPMGHHGADGHDGHYHDAIFGTDIDAHPDQYLSQSGRPGPICPATVRDGVGGLHHPRYFG